MKKLLFVALILIVLTYSMSFALSKFPDTIGTKYDTAVEKLTGLNVITGFPDGTFKPGEAVTRAQLAKMLVEGLSLNNVTNVPLTQFSDLTDKHWGYKWIKTAVDNELIVGYPDGTFKPDATVTYAESMAMILRALKLESQMVDKTWPTGYMNEASRQGLLNNVALVDANEPANRGEVSISLYNMTLKLEKQKKGDELAKAEAEQKARKEAEQNAMDFGIVLSTSTSKDEYIIKLDGDKTKYELYSLKGSTKLTDSKVEALQDSVIGYHDESKGMVVVVSYTNTSFDKAVVITKVEDSVLTFKDKSTIDFSKATTKTKYNTYSFIRIMADVDDDDKLFFNEVKDLGVGPDKVKFNKNERVLIDETNEVFVLLNGLSASSTIKKGVVDGDEEDEDGDYSYGWVTSVTTKSKYDYAKIGKVTYQVSSKSDDFEEGTYACYEVIDEDEDYEIIKLSRTFGPELLDSSAKIITSVSGTKAGSQKVTYKGDSSSTDYYSSTNSKKYKDYHVVMLYVSADSKGVVTIDDYEVKSSLSSVKFVTGDRVVIDTTRKVFAIYEGLSSSKYYKNGKETEATTYTIKYAWDSKQGAPEGGTLPASASVKEGASYTAKLPTLDGYSFTASPASISNVTKAQTITISWKKVETEKDKAEKAVEEAQKAVDAAQTAYDKAEKALKDAQDELEGALAVLETVPTESEIADLEKAKDDAKKVYDDAEKAFKDAKDAFDEAESGDDDYEDLKKAKEDAEKDRNDAKEDYEDALDDYNKAVKARSTATKNVTAANGKVATCEHNLEEANTALENAKKTLKEKQDALAALS